MNKRRNTIIILVLLISIVGIAFFFNKEELFETKQTPFYAEGGGGAGGGEDGGHSACDSGTQWCYTSMGVRVSLYTYDGSHLKYHGSFDSEAYYRSSFSYASYTTQSMAGRIAYEYLGYTVDFRTSTRSIPTKRSFSCYFGNGCSYNGMFESVTYNEIKNYVFKGSTGEAQISNLNSLFGSSLSSDDRENIYVSVEPTALIYTGPESSRSYYYGTVYELLKRQGTYHGMEDALKIDFPSAIMTTKVFGKPDPKDFFGEPGHGKYIERVSGKKTSYSTAFLDNKEGYAMALYWGAEVIKEDTCKSSCGSSPTLECAENYCEKQKKVKETGGSTGDSYKKECMTSTTNGGCGYKVNPYPCSGRDGTPTSTNCSETLGQSRSTCEVVNGYTIISCTEETIPYYSDDLPVTLYPGLDGFNYSIRTVGTKTCKKEFDEEGWEFEYAALKRSNRSDTQGQRLLNQLDYFKTKDLNDYNYEWIDSTDKVKFGLTPSATDKELEKVDEKTHADDPKDLTPKKTIDEIKNNGKTSITKVTEQEITSYGEYIFELPKVCYSLKTGKATTATDTCTQQTVKNLKYYGFYSTEKVKSEVPTYALVIKPTSSLQETNKCYYRNQEYELSCKVDVICNSPSCEVIDGFYKGRVKFVYTAYNRYNKDVKYSFLGGAERTTLPSDEYRDFDTKLSSKRFISYILDVDTNKKYYCNQTLKAKNDNCKTLSIKPTDTDKVRDYCNKKWVDDGYDSFHDCFMDCGKVKKNTCKTLYKPDDIDGIKGYCDSHYASDGYDSKEACINDCAFIPGDYYFRTITLEDPFPDKVINGANKERKVGKNWIGYENTINNGTDTYLNSKPEYVIVADEEMVKKIKSDNENNNYSYGNEAYEFNGKPYLDGKYQSTFIANYFDCIDGKTVRGSGCN